MYNFLRANTLLMSLAMGLISPLCLPLSAHAKIIQILHTNDLHASLFTHGAPAGTEPEYGGWPQVKTVIDRLARQAKENITPDTPEGIDTVRLDAGDFTEGTSYYFADNGTNVLRAFQAMGYDAATLGNHDWMMGAYELNEAYRAVPFNNTTVLAANISLSSRMDQLQDQILPTTQIEVGCTLARTLAEGCVKVGIVGLTTNEAAYKWITKVDSAKNDLKIKPVIKAARQAVNSIRDENDVVIALTHIGFNADRKLAKKVQGIDLVVGGHSHTILESYAVVNNPAGEPVPIMQAGVNGEYVGKILIEVLPNQKPRVLSYELVPVFNSEAKDPRVNELIVAAQHRLEDHYLPENINRKIMTKITKPDGTIQEIPAKTEVRLVSGTDGPTAFSKFAAEAMMAATDSEVAIDVGALHGNTAQPAGEVTFKNLMELYPRKFGKAQDEGWYVYHSYIPGWILKAVVKLSVQYGIYISFGGITYDVRKISDEEYDRKVDRLTRHGKLTTITPYRALNVMINGEPIRNLRSYSVAAAEGVIRGAYEISKLTHIIIHKGYRTQTTMWQAMENYLSKIGVINKLNPTEYFEGKNLVEAANKGEPLPLAWINEHVDGLEAFDQIMRDIKDGRDLGDDEE